MMEISDSNILQRPYNVSEALYTTDGTASALELLEEPRNLGKNSISPETLATFLSSSHLHRTPYLIVDCRFEYEYHGGHIRGAVNLNDP